MDNKPTCPTAGSHRLFRQYIPYFCGWYYRCQSETQTLAIIPSIHKSKEGDFCVIQLITDTQTFSTQFSCKDLQISGNQIQIRNNCFSPSGITLDIHTPELRATGSVSFGEFTPIRYDIMGPFRYVPLMQCRHSVYSMKHSVDGTLLVNGERFTFREASGYLEGDRGRSFPKEYIWTYCSFPDGAIMLSVADIPFAGIRFTGLIGIVLLRGKEYRIATYLGAKAVRIHSREIIIRQGSLCLQVIPQAPHGHPLQAPEGGAMTRTIHEHPSCAVHYRFSDGNLILLEADIPNAALEYEYPEEKS